MKRHVFILAFLISFSGCATIQMLDLPRRSPEYPELPEELPYQDYKGMVHVHSRYSHDSQGDFDEMVRACRRADGDFLMVTDHNTLQGFHEKMEGFYGKTLVLIGAEYSTPSGHLLALGIEKEIAWREDIVQSLEGIAAQKGLRFVAHGVSKRSPWKSWDLDNFDGMEIYSLSRDVYDDGKVWVGAKAALLPPRAFFKSVMDYPEGYLKQWDALLAKRKVVGIGAVDAHQKVRVLGQALDDYDMMFQVVQTHALAEKKTKSAILEAFKKGHIYVGFDIVRPVRHFIFMAQTPDEKVIMGDEISFRENLWLKVFLPKKAEIRLVKDGKLFLTKETDRLHVKASEPGVYRVEVFRGKRLWILSNPIYVRES